MDEIKSKLMECRWQLVGVGLVGFVIGFLLLIGFQKINTFDPIDWIKHRPVKEMYLGKMLESYKYWDKESANIWKTYTDNRGRQFVMFCNTTYQWDKNIRKVLQDIDENIKKDKKNLKTSFFKDSLKKEIKELQKEKDKLNAILGKRIKMEICFEFTLLKDRKQDKGYYLNKVYITLFGGKKKKNTFSTTSKVYAAGLLDKVYEDDFLFSGKDFMSLFKGE